MPSTVLTLVFTSRAELSQSAVLFYSTKGPTGSSEAQSILNLARDPQRPSEPSGNCSEKRWAMWTLPAVGNIPLAGLWQVTAKDLSSSVLVKRAYSGESWG